MFGIYLRFASYGVPLFKWENRLHSLIFLSLPSLIIRGYPKNRWMREPCLLLNMINIFFYVIVWDVYSVSTDTPTNWCVISCSTRLSLQVGKIHLAKDRSMDTNTWVLHLFGMLDCFIESSVPWMASARCSLVYIMVVSTHDS